MFVPIFIVQLIFFICNVLNTLKLFFRQRTQMKNPPHQGSHLDHKHRYTETRQLYKPIHDNVISTDNTNVSRHDTNVSRQVKVFTTETYFWDKQKRGPIECF